ncbi:MAG: peptidase M16 [Chloroflexi bacterium]|nr:MAG: peptidase M16 [Chloroflexota bacterium]
MTTIHGFTLVREQKIPELNTLARIWRHDKTGAQLLSMESDDENKSFGITFRTPPTDSTGTAHIMEHAVLAGSRKYRLKEPFIHLVKGSLKTFLNAMTYPDRTAYPVASTNLQDFYNLVEVYLDAVFYPLITRHHLDQEGWHYELERPDAPLAFRGVVFNEMKGAYSSPDALLYRYSKQTLFPDTAYGFDSGGDPAQIPDLTYEQFKRFHETYYHPSNALIYFYGDDDPDERLRILDNYLRDFDPIAVNGEVALQPPFDAPQQFTFPYGIDAGDDSPKKAMVQVNWLLPENTDQVLLMGLDLMSDALVGTQASPLRKALVDSGLGDDVTGGGLGAGMRQMTFAVGLKGITPDDADKVEELIFATLEKTATEGIDPDTVEAALNSTEFALRENNTGSFPRGLSLLFRALTTWTYGGDPLAPLAYEGLLAALKQNLAADPQYLQKLIRTHLLENPHRTTVLLTPDPEHNARLAAAEQERLAKAQASMDEATRQAIVANTAELKRLQEAPDDPAALAALPSLKLSDLDKEVKTIPIEVLRTPGGEILYHDLFTNGIIYLDLGLNLRTLPQDLLPYVDLFGRSLTEMGTETEDYVKLSQRIGRKTGGIYATTMLSAVRNHSRPSAWFLVRGKATTAQAQELLDILHDVLLTVKLDNPERFRQIVHKVRSRSEASLIPGGSAYVASRLRAAFNQADWADEQIGGISYLFFLRQLEKQIDQDWPSVLANLEAVRRHLLNRQSLLANVTLDTDNWAAFEPQLQDFLAGLPAAEVTTLGWSPSFATANEGLTIPAQVNYVGKGANLYDFGYRYHGSISVITNFIRTGWLWDKVRMQGGAYGAGASFSKQSGVWTFTSYRDPNLLNTLAVYDQTANVLRTVELSDDELTKSIIGAIGAMDAYQLPDAKGWTSMVRYLLGETDASRQQTRDEVLGTTVQDFRRFADVLAEVSTHGRIVVMGSPTAIDTANGDGWLQVQKVL